MQWASQPHNTHGPEPHARTQRASSHPSETRKQGQARMSRLRLLSRFCPNRATTPNHKDPTGPLDSSFIWGCEWIRLQQGDWERNCITAGHLGSWLESTPSFSAFWRGEAESIEWQVKVVDVQTHTDARASACTGSRERRRGWSGMTPAAAHKRTICCLGADLERGHWMKPTMSVWRGRGRGSLSSFCCCWISG